MTQRALLATLFPYTTLFRSVTSRQGNIDALLLQLLPQPTELLESRDGDRAVVALALQLPRRYLNERLHHLRQFLVHDRSHPGALGEVIHEDVIALLRIGPQVE